MSAWRWSSTARSPRRASPTSSRRQPHLRRRPRPGPARGRQRARARRGHHRPRLGDAPTGSSASTRSPAGTIEQRDDERRDRRRRHAARLRQSPRSARTGSNARLAIAFDLSAGRYLAAFQGLVSNYLVDGVGLFDVNTDLDMTNSAGRLRAHAAASPRAPGGSTMRRLRDLLGGSGTVTANVAMEPSGLIRVAEYPRRLAGLQRHPGGGTYSRRGALDLGWPGSAAPTARSRSTSPARRARRASRSLAQVPASASASATSAPRSARRAAAGRCWRPANPITGRSRPTW